MGERERSHYKFQNRLLSDITPFKKMVIEDTRLAKVCENVSIALEENQRLPKTKVRKYYTMAQHHIVFFATHGNNLKGMFNIEHD
jgi:hypothetical protein